MIRLDCLQAGRAIRGTPRRGFARSGRWPATALLACVVLSLSGCRSDPCGGGCGSGLGLFGPTGFFARTSYRIFNRPVAVADPCCGTAVVGPAPVVAAPVSVGAPVPMAAPAATVVPGPPAYGGTVVTPPSAVPPAPQSGSNELDPIPKSRVEEPRSGAGSQSSTVPGKTSYQTRRSDPAARVTRQRRDDLARTTSSTPVPTSRSAQASSLDQSDDLLDHLPPLDLPGEVTRSATPPRPPAAQRETKPPDNVKTSARLESSPRESELEVSAASGPPPDPSPAASDGPGVARFVAVDLKLAGGSAPTTAGLRWLSEKGYRTLLDLRETSEVPPTFISEVSNQGLRYIALPISKKTIDRDHVARFNFEMAAADSRPLFFFDADGSSAGALWYIRRVVVDHVDQQIAHREAAELGLSDQTYWLAAADYAATASGSPPKSASNPAAKRPAPAAAKGAALAPGEAHQSATPGTAAVDTKNSLAQKTASPPATMGTSFKTGAAPVSVTQATAAPLAPSEQKTLAPLQPPTPEPPLSSDPDAWRPLAAMVVTGLSLPLAFCCRTIVPSMVAKALASLPAPGHRPKSLPSKSDA